MDELDAYMHDNRGSQGNLGCSVDPKSGDLRPSGPSGVSGACTKRHHPNSSSSSSLGSGPTLEDEQEEKLKDNKKRSVPITIP